MSVCYILAWAKTVALAGLKTWLVLPEMIGVKTV